MSYELTIEYGDDVLLSAGMSRSEFDHEAAFLLAGKLYELGRLSSGQAAKMCGRSRVDFLLSLPRIGISMSNLGPEDIEPELKFLRRA
jgi:predicted HTH domain antitoxin